MSEDWGKKVHEPECGWAALCLENDFIPHVRAAGTNYCRACHEACICDRLEAHKARVLAEQTCDDHRPNISMVCAHYWSGWDDGKNLARNIVTELADRHGGSDGSPAALLSVHEIVGAIDEEESP